MKRTLLFLFFAFTLQNVFSKTVVITENFSEVNLIESAELFIDSTNLLDYTSVQTKQFSPLNGRVSYGNSPYNFWMKFGLKLETDEKAFIEIPHCDLDTAEVFIFKGDSVIFHQLRGDAVPVREREVYHHNLVYELPAEKEELLVLIKINAQEGTTIPAYIRNENQINDSRTKGLLFFGIYLGVFVIITLYNLFFAIRIKEASYFYYVFHAIFVFLIQTGQVGLGSFYIWKDSLWLAKNDTFIYATPVTFAGIMFFNTFLNTKVVARKAYWFSFVLIGIYVVGSVIALSGNGPTGFNIIIGNHMLVSVFLLSTSIYLVRKGNRSAIFYLVGWSVFMISLFNFALVDMGVTEYSVSSRYSLAVGSIIEVVIFSLALADQFAQAKRAKQHSDQAILQLLRDNERLLNVHNSIDKDEKTLSNEKFIAAKEELFRTQKMLLSEKEKRESELVQKNLQLQMNPHFIFNVLTSIQGLYTTNNLERAAFYISKYAQLMRSTLEGSRNDYMLLEEEINTLKNYVDLENLRFSGSIHFNLNVDDQLDPSILEVPPMILQPYVENAIVHGLEKKQGEKQLTIDLKKIEGELMLCTITDNGVGRKAASEQKKSNHKSVALDATKKRLRHLGPKANIVFQDLMENGQASGTKVEIKLPLKSQF